MLNIQTLKSIYCFMRRRWAEISRDFEAVEFIMALMLSIRGVLLLQSAHWMSVWYPLATTHSAATRQLVNDSSLFWGGILNPGIGGIALIIGSACCMVGLFCEIMRLRQVGNYVGMLFWLYAGVVMTANAGWSGLGFLVFAGTCHWLSRKLAVLRGHEQAFPSEIISACALLMVELKHWGMLTKR
jgi:hypothetical protein